MYPLLLFAALALTALAGALGVLLSRNAVYSALSLLVNFASIAVMYFMLSAQFLGVVQITVYAGAIVVLFLFVVMLIGGVTGPARAESRPYARVAAVLLGAILLAGLVFIVANLLPMGGGAGPSLTQGASPLPVGAPDQGSVQAIGEALYVTHLVPFELASVLLLVGMLGGLALARRYKGVIPTDAAIDAEGSKS